MVDVRATLGRFPESEGFRCDLRQVGPQGFSIPMPLPATLPLDLGA